MIEALTRELAQAALDWVWARDSANFSDEVDIPELAEVLRARAEAWLSKQSPILRAALARLAKV